jgi:hypothetical protein
VLLAAVILIMYEIFVVGSKPTSLKREAGRDFEIFKVGQPKS